MENLKEFLENDKDIIGKSDITSQETERLNCL